MAVVRVLDKFQVVRVVEVEAGKERQVRQQELAVTVVGEAMTAVLEGRTVAVGMAAEAAAAEEVAEGLADRQMQAEKYLKVLAAGENNSKKTLTLVDE